jgi:lipid-binding SYLF domain-containing protein
MGVSAVNAEDVVSAEDEQAARDNLQLFLTTDDGIQSFLDQAAGYAVFPKVGQAGFVIGGAHGKGVAFENGEVIGSSSITSGQIGLVAGVQSFSELVIFQTPEVFGDFKDGSFDWNARAGGVVAKQGGASNASFSDGVAVFLTNQGGLMGDISVGAQKFKFTPLP